MYTGTVYRGMEENIFQLHRGMFIRTDPETTRRLTRRQAELGASDFRKGFAFFFLLFIRLTRRLERISLKRRCPSSSSSTTIRSR